MLVLSARISPDYAVFGVIIVFGLLVLVALAVGATQLPRTKLGAPVIVLVWAVLILSIGSMSLLFTGYFFNWPRPIRPYLPLATTTAESSRHDPPSLLSIVSSTTLPVQGKVGTFGGPDDAGLGPNEQLALVRSEDLNSPDFKEYFLPQQPPSTAGLGRRLNPSAFYIACRWNWSQTPRDILRQARVRVTNPRTGESALAKPIDYGPPAHTGRVADISPGLASYLHVHTDDEVFVSLPNTQ